MTWLLVTRCPLAAQLWRFWASFPGIHIAQFPFQVIGNCGVISLVQCSNDESPRQGSRERPGSKSCILRALSTLMTHAGVYTGIAATNAGWRCAQYDGIV